MVQIGSGVHVDNCGKFVCLIYRQQLKAQICMYQENSEMSLYELGEQALATEQVLSVNDICSYIDNINTADVANVRISFC